MQFRNLFLLGKRLEQIRLSLQLGEALRWPLSFSLHHTHSHSHTLTHLPTHTHSYSHTQTPTHSHSHSPTHPFLLSHSHLHPLTSASYTFEPVCRFYNIELRTLRLSKASVTSRKKLLLHEKSKYS